MDIRKKFKDFFVSRGHYLLQSSSLVPFKDNSLLWINSGIAALKPFFTGRKTPPSLRMVSSQKCIRTIDIGSIGFDARHLSFFEMLGNFSIGNYFKKDAIIYAWEFLTSPQYLNLKKERLFVTVYEKDKETYEIWKDIIKIPTKHIIKCPKKTNFWQVGEGPCGPNTEIFYDRGEVWDLKNKGTDLLKHDLENDRYIEIWNIVFSQYNFLGDDKYEELPKKNIDTGAGLERLHMIKENANTIYEISLFTPILERFDNMLKNTTHKLDEKTLLIYRRIIVDHIKTICFGLGDGVLPSNKDRGYVMRRLIRRANTFGKKIGLTEPFLFNLVKSVIQIYGNEYKVLREKEAFIKEIILGEEISFDNVCKSGHSILQEVLVNSKKSTIEGKEVFRLFSTFGLPFEYIEDYFTNNKKQINKQEFENEYSKHTELSKKAIKFTEAMKEISGIESKILGVKTEFVYGKDSLSKSNVLAIITDDEINGSISNNQKGIIVLDKTIFYAERGGQIADTGKIIIDKDNYFVVDNVLHTTNNVNLHYGYGVGKIKTGDKASLTINKENRYAIACNHTATHLLNAALRKILGPHVTQNGSKVGVKNFRFDFIHHLGINWNTIRKVNEQVNKWIEESHEQNIRVTTYEKAIDEGALALFPDTYSEKVRVLSYGDFSKELCGGTHSSNTQQLQKFLITDFRKNGLHNWRIEACTTSNTIADYLKMYKKEFINLHHEFLKKAPISDLPEHHHKYSTIRKILSKENITFEDYFYLKEQIYFLKSNKIIVDKKSTKKDKYDVKYENELENNIKKIANFKYLLQEINDDITVYKEACDKIIKTSEKLLIILIQKNENNRYTFVIWCSQALIGSGINSTIILGIFKSSFSIRGGGKPSFAQGVILNNENTVAELKTILVNGLKNIN